MVELVVFLTVFTYGSNFILYRILKRQKTMNILEKISIVFGINMSVLLLDGFFAFLRLFALSQEGMLFE
ncbi:hypothetical protein ACSFB8_12175 [Enterococcus faecalis]